MENRYNHIGLTSGNDRPARPPECEATAVDGLHAGQAGASGGRGSVDPLLAAVGPQLLWLHRALEVPHALLLVSDAGVILASWSSLPGVPALAALAPGAELPAAVPGGSGIAAALSQGEAVVMQGSEHTQPGLRGLVTCGVPVQGSDGGLGLGAVGLIVPSQHYHPTHRLLLAQAALAAAKARGGPTPTDYLDTIAAVSRFTAHALGNPLTGLTLTLDLLLSQQLDPNVSRLTQRCQRLIERLTEFKENLGALGGSLKSRLEPVQLAEVVRAMLEGQRLGSHYATPVEIEPSLASEPVLLNTGLISTALSILVRNATDASPMGGTVGVQIKRRDGGMRITVWDDGPGVLDEHEGRLFMERFSTRRHGAGLGLLMVRLIVERIHGGKVSYSRREPHGTQFHLDFVAQPPLVARDWGSADHVLARERADMPNRDESERGVSK